MLNSRNENIYTTDFVVEGNNKYLNSATGDISVSGNTVTVTKINGTALSGLATGLLKNTTGTGTVTIASVGNDYIAGGQGVNGQIAIFSATGTLISVAGLVLTPGSSQFILGASAGQAAEYQCVGSTSANEARYKSIVNGVTLGGSGAWGSTFGITIDRNKYRIYGQNNIYFGVGGNSAATEKGMFGSSSFELFNTTTLRFGGTGTGSDYTHSITGGSVTLFIEPKVDDTLALVIRKAGGGATVQSWNTTTAGTTISGTMSVTGHVTIEGVTTTGATGTGNIVYSIAPTFTGIPILSTALATSLGVGTSSPMTALTVLETGTANFRGLSTQQISSNTSGANVVGIKARGTVGSETALLVDDILLNLIGEGAYALNSYTTTSKGGFSVRAAENWSATNLGTYLDFQTVIIGTTIVTTKWRIDGNAHFITATDNVYDIGANGATRPRTGYFGTSLITPYLNITGTAGAGYVEYLAQSSNASAPSIIGFRLFSSNGGGFRWVKNDGGTDTFVRGISATLTADRIWTFPDRGLTIDNITTATTTTQTGIIIGNGTNISSISGTANQILRRNSANTAYEFYTSSSGSGDLISTNNLSDVENVVTARNNILPSRTGNSVKFLRVNAAETDWELVTISGGGDALQSSPLSQFAATTSAQLRGVISDETGSGGGVVFATSPTFNTDIRVPLIYGATTSAANITISSTSHSTKGNVLIGSSTYIETTNRFGIGISPTATIHLRASDGSVSSSPLKFEFGSALISSPEIGAIEPYNDRLYFTITTGAARKTIAYVEDPIYTVIEKNLGTTAKSGKFTITSSGLTTGRQVLVKQATGPYTGKGTLADESVLDSIIANGVVTSATNIDVYWNSATSVKGNFKFIYQVNNN